MKSRRPTRRRLPRARRADAAAVFSSVGWSEDDVHEILLDPRTAGVGDFPPIIEEDDWIGAQVKLISDMGPEAYARALLDSLKEAFSGYADMLAEHTDQAEPEGLADPRSTEEIRESYLRGKREHSGDPLIIELCDAGLALLDAEVALHDAPLGHRGKARTEVEAARKRMDRAGKAILEATDAKATNVLDFLRDWKSGNVPH